MCKSSSRAAFLRWINQQSAPCKARLVMDGQDRYGKSGRTRFHQLQKCLKAVQDAQRSRGGESRTCRCDFERIGFVLAEFLDFGSGVFAANHQRCLGGISRVFVEGHSSLAAELVKKSRNAAFETRVLRAGERYCKQLIDYQLPRAHLNFCGNRHQRESGGHLGRCKTC